MFQSEEFSHVVFSLDELKYWAGHDVQPPSPFKPTLVRIASKWETATVLQRTGAGSVLTPTGVLGVASRKPNSARELARALSQCKEDLRAMGSGYDVACAWWDSFIGHPSPDGLSLPTGLFIEPDATSLAREASFSFFAPLGSAARLEAPNQVGGQRALESAVAVPHLRTVNSSISRAERVPPRHGTVVVGEESR